jgi:hypothetical protein
MKDHQLRECEDRNQKLEAALEGIRAAIWDPKVTLPLLKRRIAWILTGLTRQDP